MRIIVGHSKEKGGRWERTGLIGSPALEWAGPCIAGVAEEIPATASSRCGGEGARCAVLAIGIAAMNRYTRWDT